MTEKCAGERGPMPGSRREWDFAHIDADHYISEKVALGWEFVSARSYATADGQRRVALTMVFGCDVP